MCDKYKHSRQERYNDRSDRSDERYDNECECYKKHEDEREGCGHKFKAILTGTQQVPPVITDSSGFAKATLKGNILKVRGSFENLSSDFNPMIGAHIHFEVGGRNGPIIFNLEVQICDDNKSGRFGGTFILNDIDVRRLLDRQLYINIHTINNPNGEIRGQLLSKSSKYFTSNLFGTNEVPPVNSTGAGTILFELKDNHLTASGSVNNLNSPITAGHIHIGTIGVNGPVVFPFNFNTTGSNAVISAQNNVFALTCEQKMILIQGGYYTNFHTTTNTSGEIRGQIFELQ